MFWMALQLDERYFMNDKENYWPNDWTEPRPCPRCSDNRIIVYHGGYEHPLCRNVECPASFQIAYLSENRHV